MPATWSDALIAHPAVRRVNFTGSSRVGKIIAKKCAEYLKPVLLELGGKSPLVILDDADLDEAVNAAAFGAFANQGQICMSTERIVVDEKVADEFVKRFAAKAKSLVGRRSARGQGDPGLGGGPLRRRPRHLAGAGCGAPRAPSSRPAAASTARSSTRTCSTSVTPEMRIYEEESFGPGHDRGARARRRGGDPRRQRYALRPLLRRVQPRRDAGDGGGASRLDTGICHINGPTVHDEAQMPFGGVKDSGYGRFGGKAAINEFTELRWITIQSGHRHYPF